MTEVRQEQQLGLLSRIVRGGLWNLSGQGLTLVTSLLATPLTIRLLGTERYGVLALINLLVGYLAFADWGMGTASTRFAAAAHAHNDEKGEAAAVWAAFVVSAVPVSLAAGTLILTAPLLLQRVLHIPQSLQPEAVLALQIAAFGLLGRAAGAVLNTPQLVRLKLRLNTSIMTTGSVLQVGLMPLIIFQGGGLIGVASLIAGISLLIAICHLLFSWRLLPALLPPRFDWTQARKLAGFGGSVVLMNLAGLLLVNAEKVLLTHFNSVNTLAYYTVASTLASMLNIPMYAIGQTLLPTFAGLQAAGKKQELEQLYQDILRGVLLGTPLIGWLVCLGAKTFFIFWAGPAYGEESTWPFYILMIGLYFNITTYLPYDLFVAFGRADLNVRYHFLELGPYLLLATWLTSQWGIIGAAIAWSARLTIALPIYLYLAWRRFSLPSGFGVTLIVKQLGALLVMTGLFFVSQKFALAWHWSIPLNLLGLMAYLGIVWNSMLSKVEKERLRTGLRTYWTQLFATA